MSNDARQRHEDARNEAAFLRKMITHEAEIRARAREHAWQRMQPLMPYEREQITTEFGGECTL